MLVILSLSAVLRKDYVSNDTDIVDVRKAYGDLFQVECIRMSCCVKDVRLRVVMENLPPDVDVVC